MRKNLFVANLPDFIREDDLRELFERYGKVYDVTIWWNSRTEESEGWGFVEMEDEDDADRAIEALDGFWWHRRKLKVNESRPKQKTRHWEDFITSDCPVHFADKRHLALRDPETTLHFPLTSKALLVMRFAKPEDRLWEKLSRIIPDRYLAGFRVWHNYISYREIGAGEVDEFNRITASMAEKNIYLGSETDAFNTILAEPSQNVRLKITAAGDELRMDLKAGDSDT